MKISRGHPWVLRESEVNLGYRRLSSNKGTNSTTNKAKLGVAREQQDYAVVCVHGCWLRDSQSYNFSVTHQRVKPF